MNTTFTRVFVLGGGVFLFSMHSIAIASFCFIFDSINFYHDNWIEDRHLSTSTNMKLQILAAAALAVFTASTGTVSASVSLLVLISMLSCL
jgi:hypothetical protein